MTERQLTTKIMKLLKKEFPTAWIYKSSDRFSSGIPDILMCYHGYFIAIEIKKDTKSKVTPLQNFTLNKIRESGGLSIVVHGRFEIVKMLEKICNFILNKKGGDNK